MVKSVNNNPAVSVLMTVYNPGKYLSEAVESILNQTYQDFEFVMINDGSTDGSKKVLDDYAKTDDRIRLFHQENHGLVYSLNRGLKLAKGKLVARMDSDDVSLLERLQKQVDYFSKHPDTVLLGTTFAEIDQDGRQTRVLTVLLEDDDIRRDMYFRCPFAHGSVMFRKDAMLEIGGYRQAMWPAEDYDAWGRLRGKGDFANLPELLFQYRTGSESISSQNSDNQQKLTQKVRDTIWRQIPTPVSQKEFSSKMTRYKRANSYHNESMLLWDTKQFVQELVKRKNRRQALKFAKLLVKYQPKQTISALMGGSGE